MPTSKLNRCLRAAIGWYELGLAGEALREIEGLDPSDQRRTETLGLRAVLLQQLERWDEAATTYAELCRQPGAPVDRFIAWACCLYELNRIGECRAALLAAPLPARDQGLWNYHLACYEALLGQLDEARRLIHRSLQLDPRLRAMAGRNENLAPLIAGMAAGMNDE